MIATPFGKECSIREKIPIKKTMSIAHTYNIKTGVVKRLNALTQEMDTWTVTGGTIEIQDTGNGIFRVITGATHSAGAPFASYGEQALAYRDDCDLVATGLGLYDDNVDNPIQAAGVIAFKEGNKKLVYKNQALVDQFIVTSIVTAKRA